VNATATHDPALPAPPPAPARPAVKPTPRPAVLAVWEAEDGRCEACGRPMDKTCAQVGRDKRGERRLVCPDCKAQQPDPLAAAVVSPKTAAQLAAALGTTLEAASTWLATGLWTTGVLVRLQEGRRIYWLPAVGIFALYLDRPGRPPLIGGPLGPLYRELAIRTKPQARTRGLPRLRRPGTVDEPETTVGSQDAAAVGHRPAQPHGRRVASGSTGRDADRARRRVGAGGPGAGLALAAARAVGTERWLSQAVLGVAALADPVHGQCGVCFETRRL
jgi:hypothetical protein